MRFIYKILGHPLVYRLAMVFLTPGSRRLVRTLHQKIFKPLSGPLLDVGCGPALYTPEPEGLLVGIDVSEAYIKSYTGGFVDQDPRSVLNPPEGRRRLGFVSTATRLPFPAEVFEEVRACAVLHHLSDLEVGEAIHEMKRCLRPGGRMITIDPVWPQRPWFRPIAWLTVRFDRGRYVRRQEEMLRLLQSVCPGQWNWVRQTVTYTGLEHLCLEYVKS